MHSDGVLDDGCMVLRISITGAWRWNVRSCMHGDGVFDDGCIMMKCSEWRCHSLSHQTLTQSRSTPCWRSTLHYYRRVQHPYPRSAARGTFDCCGGRGRWAAHRSGRQLCRNFPACRRRRFPATWKNTIVNDASSLQRTPRVQGATLNPTHQAFIAQRTRDLFCQANIWDLHLTVHCDCPKEHEDFRDSTRPAKRRLVCVKWHKTSQPAVQAF